jgi:DNA-binding MarR family transcriptional regulator
MEDPVTDPLEGYELVFLLGLSFQELTTAFVDALDEAGYDDLRPVHGFALQVIAHHDGITSTELGERLGITKQGAGQLVDRLVDRGYVVRGLHPRGGRRRGLGLAERGRRHMVDAGQILRTVEAAVLAGLSSEETAALRSLLCRMIRSRVPAPTVPPLRPMW